MGSRNLSASAWKTACCDELRPLLARLIEQDRVPVAHIVEDLKANSIDIHLTGEIPADTAREFEAQFGADATLLIERHCLGCRRCWCTIYDVSERPPPAFHRGRRGAGLFRWLGWAVPFLTGSAGIVFGAQVVWRGDLRHGGLLLVFSVLLVLWPVLAARGGAGKS